MPEITKTVCPECGLGNVDKVDGVVTPHFKPMRPISSLDSVCGGNDREQRYGFWKNMNYSMNAARRPRYRSM